MKKKLLIAVVVVGAVMGGRYSFAKLEGYVPEWKAQAPVPYVTVKEPIPPGWTINNRFGLWTVKSCNFGGVEAQCSYAIDQDESKKEVKR